MTREKTWCPELMILNARSLGRLVEEMENREKEREPPDALLHQGSMLAVPILLSLAAEIALKAWQCRERNGPPDKTHDLLELFDGLEDSAQRQLEEKMPEVASPAAGLPPVYPGIRDALSQSSSVFVDWRYSYEHPSLWAGTGVLKTALKAILEGYDEAPRGLASDT